jgi:hypothetical protein
MACGSPLLWLFFCRNEIVKISTPLTLIWGFNFHDLKAIIAENRHGSGQASSEKAYSKPPTIAARQNKNHLSDK